MFKQLALAAALCTAGVANAGVLTFEGATSPFVFSGESVTDGKYTLTSYNGTADVGLSGMFIDGADQADICSGAELACPQNNASTYYASLADSYIFIELNSGNSFRIDSFDASFIGTGGLLTGGLLVIQGFAANGAAASPSYQVGLPAAVNGQYSFGTFDLTGLFPSEFAYMRIIGYGCNAAGQCNRSQNAGNFAIDNIVTSGDIPEPATFGLLGLGLVGMAAMRRRKQAA